MNVSFTAGDDVYNITFKPRVGVAQYGVMLHGQTFLRTEMIGMIEYNTMTKGSVRPVRVL